MTAGQYALRIEQGTTTRLAIRVPEDSAPLDLTTAAARMQIRERYSGPVLLDLTSDDGGGITVDADGRLVITVQPEQTDALTTTGRYDITVTDADGVRRLLEGPVSVSPSITRDAP